MAEFDSSSENEFNGENAEDLSYCNLAAIPTHVAERARLVRSLQLNNNSFTTVPDVIGQFSRLVSLDVSYNSIKWISDSITQLKSLRTLIAKNNLLTLESIPKDFGLLKNLEVVNFSGNSFETIPQQFTELYKLRCLYLGANQLSSITSSVKHLTRLEVLYLGGNRLTEIPAEVGHLHCLTALALCDNELQSLPPTLIHLRRLKSLGLHNNQLSTLPPEIVALNLVELSLRNNPLVVRFVAALVYTPPTLLELAGRCVKIHRLRFAPRDLPANLTAYLQSAHRCVNPKCKGVYFTSCVEHVKFVDFCGKYRLPLLQYLCSPKCTSLLPTVTSSASDSETDEDDGARERMRRVLLG